MRYTQPSERPSCPEGHGPEHVNRASHRTGGHGNMRDRTVDGLELWVCFLCRSRFWAPGGSTKRGEWRFTTCPRCGSTHVEKDHGGTWLCWDCDWFEGTH